MNTRHLAQQPAVIRLHHPLRDWTFRITGVLLFVGVLAFAAWLDSDLVAHESADEAAAYARGMAEGRQQMQLAYAERSRQAYQAGHDDALVMCTAAGGSK